MEPKTFKIKMEDKAAFINKAEKLGVDVNSFNIKDDLINNAFLITFFEPEEVEAVKTILKQSSDINTVKEYLRREIKEQFAGYLEM